MTARIPRLTVALLTLGVTLTAIVACGQSEVSRPESIAQPVIDAMSDTASYTMTVSAAPSLGVGEDAGSWRVEFDNDKRRVVKVLYKRDEDKCTQPPGPVFCWPSDSIVGEGFFEQVSSGGWFYTRGCEEATLITCAEWLRTTVPGPDTPDQEAGPFWIPAPTSYLTLLAHTRWLEDDRRDGGLYIKGEANPLAALLTVYPSPLTGISTEVAYYDRNPITVEVWYSESDHRISRIELAGLYMLHEGDRVAGYDPSPGVTEVAARVQVEFSEYGTTRITDPSGLQTNGSS